VIERWQFDVNVLGSQESTDQTGSEGQHQKPVEEIQKEIRAIIRQITASVTFLPVLDGQCTFNVLVYADKDAQVPVEWADSDAKEVKNAERVQLRSFSTDAHKIDTAVAYSLGE
jgi:mitotic spindle assembly checkpoint protein MAD2